MPEREGDKSTGDIRNHTNSEKAVVGLHYPESGVPKEREDDTVLFGGGMSSRGHIVLFFVVALSFWVHEREREGE